MTNSILTGMTTHGNICANSGDSLFCTWVRIRHGSERKTVIYTAHWSSSDAQAGARLDVETSEGARGGMPCPKLTNIPTATDTPATYSVPEFEEAFSSWIRSCSSVPVTGVAT